MELNFQTCLHFVLGQEGGFVDNPEDPGGATNLGITLDELARWRRAPVTIADVEALQPTDVEPIYHADYWNVTSCGVLATGIDLMVFDEAVNEGPGQAIRTLQQALGVAVDGQVGPKTLLACGGADVPSTLAQMAAIRDAYYRSRPRFNLFGKDWLGRVDAAVAAGSSLHLHH